MMHACVVFDMDDTLFLERDFVRSGLRAVGDWVGERFGKESFADVAWRLFLAGERGRIIDLALREISAPATPDVVAQAIAVYREHEPKITLLRDAEECLRELRGAAFLGVISDGPLSCQRRKAKALQLDNWMDKIVFTEELGEGSAKPNPRPFKEIQSCCGANGRGCIYVADNPLKDFLAPNWLGWDTLRVARERGLYSQVEAAGLYRARNTVHSLAEALERNLL